MAIVRELHVDRIISRANGDVYVGIAKALVENGVTVSVVEFNQMVIHPDADPVARMTEVTLPLIDKELYLALPQADVDEVRIVCQTKHTPDVVARFTAEADQRKRDNV